jgi:hypothetical protein
MNTNRITSKDLSAPKILDQNDDVSSFSCGVKDMDEFIQKGRHWIFRKNVSV